ncbi:Hypothetical_protein [Hexamita inflata]|uniref:Hypothetical_protein n=1 Tax=Hexamita inflata TaxID=28002 RepID=A0AA86PU19_9EUKA|nr:Hypothetical protein HINF_LOCUS28599 [Hexamita inflata]
MHILAHNIIQSNELSWCGIFQGYSGNKGTTYDIQTSTQLSTLNRGILPSATDLAEPHFRKLDAARNEKRNRMNPSSITLNKAGISAMPLQLQRRNAKPNRSFFVYICRYIILQQYMQIYNILFSKLIEVCFKYMITQREDITPQITSKLVILFL